MVLSKSLHTVRLNRPHGTPWKACASPHTACPPLRLFKKSGFRERLQILDEGQLQVSDKERQMQQESLFRDVVSPS